MVRSKAPLVIGAAIAAGAIVFIVSRARAAPPTPEEYVCPYCGLTLPTYDALVEHVQEEHPGERLPIEIDWV